MNPEFVHEPYQRITLRPESPGDLATCQCTPWKGRTRAWKTNRMEKWHQNPLPALNFPWVNPQKGRFQVSFPEAIFWVSTRCFSMQLSWGFVGIRGSRTLLKNNCSFELKWAFCLDISFQCQNSLRRGPSPLRAHPETGLFFVGWLGGYFFSDFPRNHPPKN